MIDIYAIYLKDHPGRTKIQSVPAGSQDNIHILNPTTKGDIGNATSMDFSVQSGTPYYGQFLQMRTYIQVDYDGDTVFYGRVITVNHDFYGGQKLHCEGAIAFLNDSYYPAEKKDTQKEISTYERIKQLLDNHNKQVNEPLKRIFIGEVPGHYTSRTAPEQQIKLETRKFGQTSWSTTKSALEDLKSHYGGAFRIRYEEGVDTTGMDDETGIGEAAYDGPNGSYTGSGNKVCYLDWLNHYYRSTVRQQTIEVGKNLIDVSRSTELSNIFTAVIPLGKTSSGDTAIYLTGYRTDIHGDNNYFPVPAIRKAAAPSGADTTYLYTDSELESGYHKAEDYRTAINQYGMVFKTMEFEEAHSQEELFKRTTEWIKENYQGGVTTFSVKAIDLHLIGENPDKILLGDRVKIRYPVGTNSTVASIEERTLTCTSVSMDLFNPDNNSYTFGIPANMLGKAYGDESNKKKKSSSPSNNSGGDNEPEETDSWMIWAKSVRDRLTYLKYWKKTNGGVEAGPSVVMDQSTIHGDYLTMLMSHDENGNNNWALLYPPHGMIINWGYIEGVKKSWYDTERDSQGRSTYDSVRMDGSTYNDLHAFIDFLEAHQMFEFIFFEHGLDLRRNANDGVSGAPTVARPTLENTLGSSLAERIGTVSMIASLGADAVGGMMQNIFQVFAPSTPQDVLIQTISGTAGDIVSKLFGDGSFQIWQQGPGVPNLLAGIDPSGLITVQDDEGNQTTLQSQMKKTKDLATELSALGISVHVIDDQVTLIGQVVSDPVSGLVTKVAAQGNSITAITSDVIQLGNRLDTNTANLTADLAALGLKVTNISADVINLGTELDEETAELTRQLVAQGLTVTNITSDVTNITGRLNGHDAKFQTIETDYATIAYLSAKHNMAAGTISASHFYVDTGVDSEMGNYDLINTIGSANITLDAATNIYTLHLYKITGGEITNPSGYNLTFSRATTLSGAWSGGTFTVSAAPQGNTFTIDFPNSQVTNKNSITITPQSGTVKSYILENQDNNHVDLRTLSDGTNYVTVARITHGKYNAGWSAAYGKVSVPTTERTNVNSITVYTPPSTVDGSANGWTYALYNDGNNAVVLQYINGSTYTTVAKLTHGKYTSGWDGCYNSLSTNDSPASKTMNFGTSTNVLITQKDSGGTNRTRFNASYYAAFPHHMKMDYRYGSGGAHANDWWNCTVYSSNNESDPSVLIQTDQSSTGILLPIVMDKTFTSNGTYNPWDFTSEGSRTGVVFGPIKVNVSSGSTHHSIGSGWTCTIQTLGDEKHYTLSKTIPKNQTIAYISNGNSYQLYVP